MQNQEIEIRRKIVHLVFGVVLAGGYFYDLIDIYVLGLMTLIGALLFAMARKIPFMEWILNNFERKKDKEKFPGKGTLFYILGAWLSISLFDKNIAIASILILAVIDSVPNIVGLYYRNIKYPFSKKKYIEGSILGVVLSLLAIINFVSWPVALAGSLGALIVEVPEIRIKNIRIDDNLLIPVFSGLIMTLARLIL